MPLVFRTIRTSVSFMGTVFVLTALGIALSQLAWANQAEKPDPYVKADQTWISISGTVDTVNPDTFTVDYGDGFVVVEMDDGDRDADAYKLVPGDKVTVSGRVDNDFYESTTIEAASVYVENVGTTFFSSSMDEETREGLVASIMTPIVVSRTEVRGTVSEVNDEEFVVDTGTRSLTVDVDTMPYNPLDEEGYQKIEVGDRVKVVGHIDVDLFEGRELKAETLIKTYAGAS